MGTGSTRARHRHPLANPRLCDVESKRAYSRMPRDNKETMIGMWQWQQQKLIRVKILLISLDIKLPQSNRLKSYS